MTAPALVALAHGSRDPRSAATVRDLVREVRAMRPDLRIEAAFLELSKPEFGTVVDRLVKAGHDEIVVVPAAAQRGLPRQDRRPRASWRPRPPATRGCRSATTEGARPGDLVPRACSTGACARRSGRARVRELDALVLAAAGTSDALATQSINRLARVWGARAPAAGHHRLRLGDPAGPRRGRPPVPRAGPTPHRRRLAVPRARLPPRPGRPSSSFEAGAVAVSEPFGADEEVARTVLARYAVGAVELVPV